MPVAYCGSPTTSTILHLARSSYLGLAASPRARAKITETHSLRPEHGGEKPSPERRSQETTQPTRLPRLDASSSRIVANCHPVEAAGIGPPRQLGRLRAPTGRMPVGRFAARPRAQQAAAAGIEPAPKRLTVAYPYQHGSHRNKSGRLDLNQRSRAPEAPGIPDFPTS
jgi:hypothetical protein